MRARIRNGAASTLPPIEDPAVLVGTSTADDAAAYRIYDPYDYGRIAAANSISDVYAITDFGLLGHLMEMAEGSGVSVRLDSSSAVPILDEVRALAGKGTYPGGATRNRERVEAKVQWAAAVSEETRFILTDPQTSGGLLVAILQFESTSERSKCRVRTQKRQARAVSSSTMVL